MGWWSFTLKFSLVVAITLLVGCVNVPSQPRAVAIPDARPNDIFDVTDDTTDTLDCQSSEIRAAGADAEAKKKRIALGPMPNMVGPKVGRVDLPPSLVPFARNALDRITSGIVIIDESNARLIPLTSDEKDVVELRLSGGIYAGNTFRVLENELDGLGFGVGSRVEATDIGIQLYWQRRVSPITFQQWGPSASILLRLYSAEQGASAFRVTSGNNGLVMARSRASQEATPTLAIQSAINVLVSALLKEAASSDWGIASTCKFGPWRRVDRTQPLSPPLSVQLVSHNQGICAVVKAIPSQPGQRPYPVNPTGSLQLQVKESRGKGIEVRDRTIRVASMDALVASERSVCLPRGAFDARTDRIEFFFRSQDGQTLGSGAYVLQRQ
jgi:hypothetical protein